MRPLVRTRRQHLFLSLMEKKKGNGSSQSGAGVCAHVQLTKKTAPEAPDRKCQETQEKTNLTLTDRRHNAWKRIKNRFVGPALF